MNPEVIKSYLVSLGFSIDKKGNADFQKTIKDAGIQVARLAGTMAKDFVAAGVAVTGALMSISGATVAMIDNIAQADMGYQLFARRMFMSTEAAKKLKIATDALGYSLEDIIWGPPELRQRYYQLIQDQRKMEGGLGGDFEGQMRAIRDVRFEFTRLRVELQYLAMGTVGAISRALFGDKDALLNKLRSVNNWLITNLPYISNQLAHYIVPIMKDMWQIGKDIWDILKDIATVFIRIIGLLSGDQALAAGTISLQSFGMAALHVANALTFVYDKLAAIVGFLTAHPTLGGALAGAIGGGSAGLSIAPFVGPESILFGAGGGAVLGGLGGFLYGNRVGAAQSGMSVAQQAALEAQRIAPQLGIPANILLSQWAHETGGFSDAKALNLHNLGGVREGSGAYKNFSSFDTFGDFITNLYQSRRYLSSGVIGSQTTDQLAAALKRGGYYEDSYANYSAGMRNRMPLANQLLGSGDTTITVGDINVTQPNMTPDQLYSTVTRAVREGASRQIMRNNVQFDGSYY